MLSGNFLKIKSLRDILSDKKTLINVLMSFYEDKEKKEENVNVREEKKDCVCLRE